MKAPKFIDWEQRRYELAKAAMQGILANSNQKMVDMDIDATIFCAISFANIMIIRLKESEEQKND